jgi:hypothetical protein
MNRKSLVLAALAILLPFAGLARAQDSGAYKVLRIQLVGGDGGFDYVTADPDGRNLYVARSGPAGTSACTTSTRWHRWETFRA